MPLNFKNTLGYGALIWVLMFAIVSVFIGFKIYNAPGVGIITAFIGGILSYIFAGYAKPKNIIQALVFGLLWAVTGIILDTIVTLRFNPNIFQEASLWLSYALGVIAPTLRVKKQ